MSETLRELEQEIRVIRIHSMEDAMPYRASFVGAYQTVWTAPPYREVFYPYEAEAVLRRTLETTRNIALMAVRGLTQVVGFGFAVPVASRPDVARQVQGLLPIPHSVYFAELGVLPRYRGLGLGRVLVEERLNAVDRQRYSHVVLRTSATKGPGYHIYSELGFDEIGVYMEVNSRRLDGNVTTDRRMLLSRVLEADSS